MAGFGWYISKRRAEKSQARNRQVADSGGATSLPQVPGALSQPLNTVPVTAQPVPNQMQVEVPQGCGPGSLLQVETPAGPMQVTVPASCGPGSTFLISY